MLMEDVMHDPPRLLRRAASALATIAHRRAAGCAQLYARHRLTCRPGLDAFGVSDLVVPGPRALTDPTLDVTPSPLAARPLALGPTVTVPLLLALHVTSIITLARAPRPAPSAAGPLIPGVASA